MALRSILTISLLLNTALAGRLSDVSQRKGFSPHLKRGPEAFPQKRSYNASEPYRFYNEKSASYFVDSLPDMPFDLNEFYSGNIPIDYGDPSRAYFFVFQPTVGEPVDEITIWLNGGPGCSSLEGFLQENGLFQWSWGEYAPHINPYSWVNLTNMLWVEHPVGVGFSTGNVTATSEEEISKEFVDFFLNFEEIFGIKKFRIFVTGESYAGRYVPYIAAEMIDRCDEERLNVSGALMYDPCIGDCGYVQVQSVAVPFIQSHNNVLGFNESFLANITALDESCGYAAFRDQYLVFPPNGTQPVVSFNDTCDIWNMGYYEAYHPNPCFNVYEIGLQCPLLSDPLGYPSDLQYASPGLPVYFNRSDVKAAMHAPAAVPWSECKGPVFVGTGGSLNEGDLSIDSMYKVLPQVIEKTNRVLVANGDLDYEVITNGTLMAIQNMTWNGQMGFQTKPSDIIYIDLPDLMYGQVYIDSGFSDAWHNPQGTMGVQHFERGLMWAETLLAGHMQPQFQGRSAYRHLQWVLGRIDKL